MNFAYLQSPPESETVVVKGAFRASMDKVWRAWTEPERLQKWFGSKAGKFDTVEADVRVGGRWRFAVLEDETPTALQGEYLTVEPHALLVFTWTFVRQLPDGRQEATAESLVTVAFRQIEGGVEVILRHENIKTEDGRLGVASGWDASFANLAATL